MTNPNCRVLIFSILRFISTKCCKTQNVWHTDRDDYVSNNYLKPDRLSA